MAELIQGLFELAKIIREDPRIGVALAVLIAAGAIAAILLGELRRDELLKLRD